MIESEYLKDNLNFLKKLKKIPTLDAFTEKDLKGLSQLSKIRKYEPGEFILKENNFDSWIYFLVSGKVCVEKNGQELSYLENTGAIFGEMGIIDGSPRSASVYAVTEVVCLATDAAIIDRLVGRDKIAFSYVLFRIFSEILANRLRVTTEELIRVRKENKRFKVQNHEGTYISL